jgi:hypothetical protein
VRSARPLCIVAGALALAGLAGCVTTQQLNERAALRAKRLLASRQPLLVTRPSAEVRVEDVALVRGARRSAVVVTLASTSAHALNDLPISVGVVTRGRRTYLNRRGGLDYFQSHLASIAPGARATWVFTTPRRLRHGARPFARVGSPARLPVSRPGTLPALVASPLGAPATASVRVRVRNPTQVPQYGLPIYALARRGGRYVAAGRATIDNLGTATTATVELELVGSARQASLQLEATPTIFK